MNIKKIALGVLGVCSVVIVVFFIQREQQSSLMVCDTQETKAICQECTCERGKPVPSAGKAACPDGSQPICKDVVK